MILLICSWPRAGNLMPFSFRDFLLSYGAGQEGAWCPGSWGPVPGLVSDYLWAMERPCSVSAPESSFPQSLLCPRERVLPGVEGGACTCSERPSIPPSGVSTGAWPCNPQSRCSTSSISDRTNGALRVEVSVPALVTGHWACRSAQLRPSAVRSPASWGPRARPAVTQE